MPDRIIIEFDDKGDKPKKVDQKEDRIVIELDNEIEKEKKIIEIEEIEASSDDKILNSKINSFFKGNSHLNNFFETDLKFPEGIEKGFRKKFSVNVKDEFFNSILESNKYIILTSRSGNIYLIDRFTGEAKDKIFCENESFEKTGLVYENKIYLNSLKKIFLVSESSEGKISHGEIYNAGNEYFIWSNLNRYKDYIVFTEHNVRSKKSSLKILDANTLKIVSLYDFEIHNFISDKICIADGSVYALFDSSLLVFDPEKLTGEIFPLDIKCDENSFIFYLNYRIYITTVLNELFALDLPPVNYKFKNTGIKNNYINSIGGFDDNIFTGTLEGWKYSKSSGLTVYSFDDEYENRIEAISRNLIVISKKNKIVFCNLNRFQEAEGYVIASEENNESVEIISAVISRNEIFVLTKKGMLEAFTNDKLNIHI